MWELVGRHLATKPKTQWCAGFARVRFIRLVIDHVSVSGIVGTVFFTSHACEYNSDFTALRTTTYTGFWAVDAAIGEVVRGGLKSEGQVVGCS